MIQESMQLVLTPQQQQKLKGSENALIERMQKQIMDFSNFTDGTIFDQIIKINEEMTEKLKIKTDLRKDEIVAEAKHLHDPVKAQEEKLDGYIIRFLNLNAQNEEVLEEAREKHEQMLNRHLNKIEERLNQNLNEMKVLAVKDER